MKFVLDMVVVDELQLKGSFVSVLTIVALPEKILVNAQVSMTFVASHGTVLLFSTLIRYSIVSPMLPE